MSAFIASLLSVTASFFTGFTGDFFETIQYNAIPRYRGIDAVLGSFRFSSSFAFSACVCFDAEGMP